MKFGKHLKAVAVEGWEYLDYKQLKQLLKRLQSTGVGSKEAGEKQFMEELINGISKVNVFFVDMERRLLAELQSSSSSSDDQLKELYGRVSDLRAHVILNYLAVLKIAKKHDKQSPNNPIREQAVEHMSGLSFYLSLEHSYLFAECREHLQAEIDTKLEGFARGAALKAARHQLLIHGEGVEGVGVEGISVEGVESSEVEGELEVSAHFERCCLSSATVLYDGSGGAVEQSPVNLKISRMLALASRPRHHEILASLPAIDETDATIAARHAARQPTGKEPSSPSSPCWPGKRAVAGPASRQTNAPEEGMTSGEDMVFVLSAARHAARQPTGKEPSSPSSPCWPGKRAVAGPASRQTNAPEEGMTSGEDMVFVLSGCEGEDALFVQGVVQRREHLGGARIVPSNWLTDESDGVDV